MKCKEYHRFSQRDTLELDIVIEFNDNILQYIKIGFDDNIYISCKCSEEEECDKCFDAALNITQIILQKIDVSHHITIECDN